MKRSPREHWLKCPQPFYFDVEAGRKNFEVRPDDRAFQTGDNVWLQEWSTDGGFGGPSLLREIIYVLRGGQFGIEPGYVVLGLAPIEL